MDPVFVQPHSGSKIYGEEVLFLKLLLWASDRIIGEKKNTFMKNTIRYTNEPMGKLRVVKDFLPPPGDLVLKEDHVKVTIALSRSSVDFFKRMARKHHTSYQKMIRTLVDAYSAQHQR